jgi:hypothetical protein
MTGLDIIETRRRRRAPAAVSSRALAFDGVAALVDHARPWCNAHDRASRDMLLRRVAGLLQVPVLDPVDAQGAAGRRLLLVPGDTIGLDEAVAAGVVSPRQVLGGAVPAFFVGTKSITHGLVDERAERPAAWSPLMADLVSGCVLGGYTAFSVADALTAGRRLLAHGPVRIKDVCGKAGLGQAVVLSEADLLAAIAQEEPAALSRCGVVLEENLTDVVTYSVGAVTLGDDTISYWGTQNLTRDHQGREVYGGSDLYAVRGDLDALARHDLPGVLAEVVRSAVSFDAAARRAYPEALLTRRNYDVIEGTDVSGARRIGVLEQSWRVGGASGAEIAALEAFRAEPDTDHVRCSTVEVYDKVIPPAGATLYYLGDDPVTGAMTKFAVRVG